MKFMTAILVLGLAGLLAGCMGPRWQIKPGQYAWGEQSDHIVSNSLLLDARTGKTWILANDSTNYFWQPVPLAKPVSDKSCAAP